MNRYIIGSLWDRDNRNGANKNFEYLFEGSKRIDALNRRADSILSKSNSTLNEAKQTNDMNENVQQQINTLIAESGTSDSEVVQARVDGRGQVYDVLNERLNKTDSEVKDRGESNYQIYKSGTAFIKNRKPTFTIQDDDVRTELYTKLYPIAQEYNIPISAGLISGRMGDHHPNTITMSQFYEMRDSGLVEFCNHTHSHLSLTNMTIDEAVEDVKKCEEWLDYHGCSRAKHLIYPFGDYSADLYPGISKYVHSATRSNNHIINPSGNAIGTFALNRVTFETDIALIKQRIDEAVNNNGWFILNTHAAYETFDEVKMREIIDYALQQGMDFDNFSNPYQNFSNILEVIGEDGRLGVISASGQKSGIFDADGKGIEYLEAVNTFAVSAPTEYPNAQISTANFSKGVSDSNGWPSAGIMFMDRRYSDAFSYQVFIPYRTTQYLIRYWNSSTNGWSEFKDISDNGVRRYSREIGPYTIPGNGRQGMTISSDTLEIGKSTIVTPNTALPNGLTYTFHHFSEGSGSLRIYNLTGSEITLESGDWVFTTI